MNRDFKGIWIPKEIWLRTDLSTSEKIMLLEIDSLSDKEGCFAKNKHFSELLVKSSGTVENMIAKLRDKGLIEIYDENGKRILKVTDKLTHEKMGTLEPEPTKKWVDTHEKMGSLIKNSTLNNTYTDVIGPQNWDNGRTDLQRFIACFIKQNNPTMYNTGSRLQVSGFYKQYCRLFKTLLDTAGSLEVACKALSCADKYYRKLGYTWGLKTLNTNWADFVGQAMFEKGGTK